MILLLGQQFLQISAEMQGQNFDHITAKVLSVIEYLMIDNRAAPIKLLSATVDFAHEMFVGVMHAAYVKAHFLAGNESFRANGTNDVFRAGENIEGKSVDELFLRSEEERLLSRLRR